jgi:tRNA synthetases class I (I, L, M and V)/NUDIX domain
MLHNIKYDAYQMPGGKVDTGETPEQALAREIKEELGVDIKIKARICARNLPAKNELWHGIYFDIELLGTPTIQEPQKHSRLEWVTFEQSEENIFGFSMNVANTIFDDELSINCCYDAVVYWQYTQGMTVDEDLPVYMLAWTTTPRTLPSNMFLAVNAKLIYTQIYHKESNCYYILAKNLLNKYFKNPAEYVVIYQMKGKELLGLQYQPIFSYIQESNQQQVNGNQYLSKMFQVLDADFVTDDAGTGIAHEAPAF